LQKLKNEVNIMNDKELKNHTLTNLVHTILLLVSMAGLLGILGWLIAGAAGVKFAMIFGTISFLFTPQLPAGLIMKVYGARPLSPCEIPQCYRIIQMLSKKAQLERMPNLYYLPSRVINAFAAGTRNDSAICITDGFLKTFSADEMAGIIGHEITHIKNNDMQVMALANLFNRLTGLASLLGQMLIVFCLPIILVSDINLSFLPFLLLILAPALSLLMHLALSRTREFGADLGSSILTGNPYFLASALNKLEQYQKNQWRSFFIPGMTSRQAHLMRTHPSTKERIRRLLSLSPGCYNRGSIFNT